MYEALPLDVSPERGEILSDLMRKIAATDSIFSEEACEEGCFEEVHEEMCDGCYARLTKVMLVLTHSQTRSYEVWRLSPDEASLVGVIFFTDIIPGLDAVGHYVFFDERLSDKTEVVESTINEMFVDLELKRLTIEIPEPFAALARHASKRLGFGGPLTTHDRRGRRLSVEGRKVGAAMWKGSAVDLLILGRLHTTPRASEAPQQAQP